MNIFWSEVTRFGESAFLLPLAALLLIWFSFRSCFRVSLIWSFAFGAGVLLVVASKIAFLGWGIGVRSLDFTGFSGHTMLAASMYPVLAWVLFGNFSVRARHVAIAVAFLFGVLIAVSRLELAAHSNSEVVAGFVLGALVACALIRIDPVPARVRLPLWVAVPVILLGSFMSAGFRTPSHQIIVELALAASGHTHPYHRDQWLLHPNQTQM